MNNKIVLASLLSITSVSAATNSSNDYYDNIQAIESHYKTMYQARMGNYLRYDLGSIGSNPVVRNYRLTLDDDIEFMEAEHELNMKRDLVWEAFEITFENLSRVVGWKSLYESNDSVFLTELAQQKDILTTKDKKND